MADEQKDQNQNPLLAALPPATDYITYLTIVEYNLNEENLPVLHQILQDSELTRNIGWDLVHLLLPLLPASEECLQDIAAKGNPREVILKVTEALRLLEFEEPQQDSDDENDAAEQGNLSKAPGGEGGESNTNPALSSTVLPPLPVLKFEVLLDLLATLHRRVKTKYPSRFLATSLQAVLTAYNRARHHVNELTLSATKFVKTLSGTKRPHLPPRASSGNLLKTPVGLSEPDPEAQSEAPTADENMLINRLLQSFVTHVIEDYVLSLSSNDDTPGFSWSSRLMEKYGSQWVVPSKRKYADRFAEEEDLKARTAIIGQLVALAQDLGLKTQELVQTIMDTESEKQGVPGSDDEPPSSAEDIPLSKTGSLFLFAARTVKQELYAAAKDDDASFLHIFPDHATILDNFVGVLGRETVGLEPEALLDTVIALGIIALEKNNIGEPTDDEHFAKCLQTTSLVSANTPSPSLRGHAHYITSTILRSHPTDIVRLTFIRDTLEHCPYENLKASAVSWLKGETLEANPRSPATTTTTTTTTENPTETNIFATPVALSTVAPFLFPDLTTHYDSKVQISDSFMQFRNDLGFYMAVLNFSILLLSATQLHEPLAIRALYQGSHVEEVYLRPLKEVCERFLESLEGGDGELRGSVGGESEAGVARGEVELVRERVGSVEGRARELGWGE